MQHQETDSPLGTKSLSVNLAEKNIGPQECKSLCQEIPIDIEKLYLNDNHIGSKGCCHLGQRSFKNLLQLQLNDNQITSEGCYHLSKGQWLILKSLSLEYNLIDCQGCKHLSGGEWPQLQELQLSHNKIIEISFLSLDHRRASYISFCNLVFLDLSHNLIESLEKVTQFDSPQLKSMILGHNKIITMSPLLKVKSKILRRLSLNNNLLRELGQIGHMNLNELLFFQLQSGSSFSLKPILKCSFQSQKKHYAYHVSMTQGYEPKVHNIIKERIDKEIRVQRINNLI